MTDHSGYPDAKHTATQHGANGSISHKRKRDPLEQDISTSRPSPGDDPRMANYRVSESASDTADQSTASFLAAHNASTTTDEDLRQSASTSMDLSALGHNSTEEHDQQHNTQHHNQKHQQRPEHSLHPNGRASIPSASDTAAAALSHYSMTVPQATELSFQTQGSAGSANSVPTGNDGGQQINSSYGLSDPHSGVEHSQPHGMSDYSIEAALKASTHGSQMPIVGESPPHPTTPGRKPTVGSDEWNKIRRDNHKEVERRRRETINEGINELAKIVPGCEKNKGSILQRAVQFITQLKENEAQNIEKWTLEKLLTEQAIAELSASCDKLKAECHRAWTGMEVWKKAALDAGVDADTVENGNAGNYSEGDGRGGSNGGVNATLEDANEGGNGGVENKRAAENTIRKGDHAVREIAGSAAMDGSR